MRRYTNRKAPLKTLFKCASESTGINPNDILKKTRQTDIVMSRQLVIVYILSNYRKEYNLRQIGEFVGGKNHATIIHTRKVYFNLLDAKDKKFMKALDLFKEKLISTDPNFSINMIPEKLTSEKK